MAESSFEDLREILNFVSSEIKVKPAVFEKMISNKAGAKLFMLVKCLQQENITEPEILKTIYGNSKDTGNYRALKLELKNKLLNLVFLSDNDLALKNSYFKSQFRMKRNGMAAEFLILRSRRKEAMNLLRPAFETALHLKETQSAVMFGKLLSEDAAYNGDKKKLAYYQKETAAQQRLLMQESAMHEMFHTVLSPAARTSGYSREELRLIKHNFKKAGSIYRKHSSYYIMLYYSRIAVLYFQSRNEHSQVIRQCRRFNAYLQKIPQLYQGARYGEFALFEMDSHVRLGQFSQGRQCAYRCLQHFIPFSITSLQFHEYYFLLAMRTGNTDEALVLYTTVTTSPKFKKLPPLQRERWHIYEAFLHFALPNGLPKKQFNLFRFLNEVPRANRDKHGYNFTILVAQVILLISIRDTEKLLNLEFSFRSYHRKYIRKQQHPRHFIFGNMLKKLLKNDFNFEDEKIKNYLVLLRENAAKIEVIEEAEVIPFETLWKMLRKKVVMNKSLEVKQRREPDKIRLPEKILVTRHAELVPASLHSGADAETSSA